MLKRLRWIAGLILALGVVFTSLYVFRDTLISPRIAAVLESVVESQTGLKIAVGKLGGNYVSNLEIENVRTIDRGQGIALTCMQWRRLRVAYSLWDLFGGIWAFLAGCEIDLEHATLEIDLAESGKRAPDDTSSGGLVLPPVLPRVTVIGSSVVVRGQDFQTGLDNLTLQIEPDGAESNRVRLGVEDWRWSHPALKDGGSGLEFEATYGNGRVKISRLYAAEQSLVESAAIDLGALPEKLPFDLRLRAGGGRMEADGRLENGRLLFRLDGGGIDLSMVSRLLKEALPAFGGNLSVKGQLDLPLESLADLTGDLDIRIETPVMDDFAADGISATFSAGDGTLRVENLALVDQANQVTVGRAEILASTLFEGDPNHILKSLSADLGLNCTDIPALLKLAGVVEKMPGKAIPEHRLEMTGRIHEGVLVVPEGDFRAEGGYLRIENIRITLPDRDRGIADCSIEGEMKMELPDLALVGRIFNLPELGGTVNGDFQVTGTLASPQGSAELKATGVGWKEAVIGDLVIRAIADSQRVMVESASLTRGRDSVAARGTVGLADKTLENVQMELEIFDVGPYVKEFLPFWLPIAEDVPDVHGRLEGFLSLSGNYEKPGGRIDLKGRGMRVASQSLGDLDIDLKFSENRFAVKSTGLRNGEDRLLLSGSYNAETGQISGADLVVEIADLKPYAVLLPSGSVSVSGGVHGGLKADGDILEPDARADLRIENFVFNGTRVDSGMMRLRNSGRILTVDLIDIRAAAGQLLLGGTVGYDPDFKDFDISVSKATVTGKGPLLALVRPARIGITRSGRIEVEELVMSGPVGRLTAKGYVSTDDTLDLAVTAEGLRSDGWFELISRDRFRFQGVDSRIRLFGPARSPFFSVFGAVAELGSPEIPMTFSGRFDLDYRDKILKVNELKMSGAENQGMTLSGTLPIDVFGTNLPASGLLSIAGNLNLDDAKALNLLFSGVDLAGGPIQGDFKISGNWQRPEGEFHLSATNLGLSSDTRPLPPGPYKAAADLRITGNRVFLDNLQVDSPAVRMNAAGRWLGAPVPADIAPGEKMKYSGEIHLDCSLDSPDLSWLGRQVDGIRRLSGRLEARAGIHGPVSAPSAEMMIHLSRGAVTPDFDMPAIEDIQLSAAITPSGAKIESFSGRLGGSLFELTGTAGFGGDDSEPIRIRLRGENLLLYRNETLRLRADSDLFLEGPISRLKLSGNMVLTDGVLTKNFGVLEGVAASGKPSTGGGFQLFSIKEAPFKDLKFDVKISARESFKIRSNLCRGSVSPDLTLTGTGELPLLTGQIYAEPTRLYMPAGILAIESGLIRFEKSDPDRPRLDLLGTTSMLGYDIKAVVSGPYDEPVVTLSSIPPLPNDELLMLLLAGQPPKSRPGLRAGGRKGMNMAVFLGRDMISRLADGESEEAAEFILDRFDMEIGRDVSRKGEETINARFRLADNFFRQKDSLYLTGERDIFDYFNGGIRLVFRFR